MAHILAGRSLVQEADMQMTEPNPTPSLCLHPHHARDTHYTDTGSFVKCSLCHDVIWEESNEGPMSKGEPKVMG